MRIFLTFAPILLAASWAIYNIFFLIKKSIPNGNV
uniref:PsbY n=1 Tax=Neotessella volvocina TaxID=52559 RepID=A0A3G2R052_9STRA|nr:PsbY [Neotessella volvocina]AYO28757.1 PsbY [Neotessella volvocina]